MPDATNRLTRDRAALLVVDLQAKLLPAIHESSACIAAAGKLIAACDTLAVPVITTEQYPEGLGTTCDEIRTALGERPRIAKTRFSACVDPVMQQLRGLSRSQVIITGVETHVCVQQSVLDLLRDGRDVWVCADAVSSRRPFDRDVALERMRHAGAIITTAESVIFELLGCAGTDEFKKILKIVK